MRSTQKGSAEATANLFFRQRWEPERALQPGARERPGPGEEPEHRHQPGERRIHHSGGPGHSRSARERSRSGPAHSRWVPVHSSHDEPGHSSHDEPEHSSHRDACDRCGRDRHDDHSNHQTHSRGRNHRSGVDGRSNHGRDRRTCRTDRHRPGCSSPQWRTQTHTLSGLYAFLHSSTKMVKRGRERWIPQTARSINESVTPRDCHQQFRENPFPMPRAVQTGASVDVLRSCFQPALPSLLPHQLHRDAGGVKLFRLRRIR